MNYFIHGTGAVSPAGWNTPSLCAALAQGNPLPAQAAARPGSTQTLPIRMVPRLLERPKFMAHPRLRRASPITQFAVSAAFEALGSDVELVRAGTLRLAVIVTVMAGCVNYSRRFYEEVLRDPATASPLVFPETVFNAPASHLATVLGSAGLCYTLVGDAGTFLAALAHAAACLADAEADAALIVAAEESDWLVADASRRFRRGTVVSEGAGALYLRSVPAGRESPRLVAITDAHSFLSDRGRSAAVANMRGQMPVGTSEDLLVDSQECAAGSDAIEKNAWAKWPGARLSPTRVLGDGLAAGSAWQCVAAVDSIREGRHRRVLVSAASGNQQAIGAVLESQ